MLERAIEEDINQNYLDAIRLYEEALLSGDNSFEAFLNLLFLYWIIASKFAFRDQFRIPDDLASIYWVKYKELLASGLKKYPNNCELVF